MSSLEMLAVAGAENEWCALVGGVYEHIETGFRITRKEINKGFIHYLLCDPESSNFIFGSPSLFRTIEEAKPYIESYKKLNAFENVFWTETKNIIDKLRVSSSGDDDNAATESEAL